MKNKKYTLSYVIALAIILAASFYPLYMGVCVVSDMICDGTVLAENYPKYIIPYTPISLAVLFGTLIMPISQKYLKKASFALPSVASVAVFFVIELLLEKLVIVTETVETTLESWQMFMCYVAPSSYTTKVYSAEKMLIGDYSPTFKLHFYIISVLLVVAILNCIYGFSELLAGKNKGRTKALVLQSVSTFLFLSLCILACFTAFWRTGEIVVSPLSAFLMAIFFILFGLTAGIFHASFAVGKRTLFSRLLPSVTSVITVIVMYAGELILLSGKLYRYGHGFFFDRMGFFPFSLCDLVIIAVSGVLCFLLINAIEGFEKKGVNKK